MVETSEATDSGPSRPIGFTCHLLAGAMVGPFAGPMAIIFAAFIFPYAIFALFFVKFLIVAELIGLSGALFALPLISISCQSKRRSADDKARRCGSAGLFIMMTVCCILMAYLLLSPGDASAPPCIGGFATCALMPVLFLVWIAGALCAGAFVSGLMSAMVHDRALLLLTRLLSGSHSSQHIERKVERYRDPAIAQEAPGPPSSRNEDPDA